jgi:pheromone shutdown-related protein TraB
MGNEMGDLPGSVRKISLEGKDVFLVGTAHVSKQSVEDVRKTITMVRPDSVCVELCESRYKSIIQRELWKNMDIVKVVREKKAVLLLAQMIMSSFYRRLGDQLDVKPGAEMIEGVTLARENGHTLVLADRNIEITLKRVWGSLGFWNRMKMASQLFMGVLFTEKIDAALVEDLKNQDQLEQVLDTFAKAFPGVKSRLIDERDIYLARKISHAPGKTVVAVVGAGHVPGICAHIASDQPLEPLETIPAGSAVSKIVGWFIPLSIIGLIVYGFFNGGSKPMESVYIWILVTGSLSALGAACAFAHPLAILTSFVAAPLTTLHPLLAAGWFSGLIQAIVKKPTVQDMEELPNAIATFTGLWRNPVSRILLVVALANLGSSLGMFIAGGWIAKLVL